MGKNERWKCHLECHLMSGDFAYSDQYTATIDHNLTQDKAVMSGLWANDLKSKACYCGVPSGCASARHDVDAVWEQAHDVTYFVTRSEEGDR